MPIHESPIIEVSAEELAGQTALVETGIEPEELDRIATIQLDAGGKCVGTLVEFIGIEKHAPIKRGVVETIKKARDEGNDVVQAVEGAMGLYAKRDEQGEIVRAPRVAEKK